MIFLCMQVQEVAKRMLASIGYAKKKQLFAHKTAKGQWGAKHFRLIGKGITQKQKNLKSY